MSNVGPVCHIPPANQPANPQPHNVPGLPASVPDPKSPTFNQDVAAFLTQILAMLRQLSGQDAGGFNRVPKDDNTKTRWVEESRVETKMRIYQNNDPTSANYVDVNQMNKLVMRDKATGQRWTWQR